MAQPYTELYRGRILLLDPNPNIRYDGNPSTLQSETGTISVFTDTYLTLEINPNLFSRDMAPLHVTSAERDGDIILLLSRSYNQRIRIVSLFHNLSNNESRRKVVQLVENQANRFHHGYDYDRQAYILYSEEFPNTGVEDTVTRVAGLGNVQMLFIPDRRRRGQNLSYEARLGHIIERIMGRNFIETVSAPAADVVPVDVISLRRR